VHVPAAPARLQGHYWRVSATLCSSRKVNILLYVCSRLGQEVCRAPESNLTTPPPHAPDPSGRSRAYVHITSCAGTRTRSCATSSSTWRARETFSELTGQRLRAERDFGRRLGPEGLGAPPGMRVMGRAGGGRQEACAHDMAVLKVVQTAPGTVTRLLVRCHVQHASVLVQRLQISF
jgi:hypothetical protein